MPRTWAACSTLRRLVGAHICDCSPGAGEDLVGPPPEQERVGALEDLVDERRGLVVLVEQRQGPSAARESATAVLIRPAESLHHAVDGDVRDGRQFHGFVLSLVFCVSAYVTNSSLSNSSIWPTRALITSAKPLLRICSIASREAKVVTITICVLVVESCVSVTTFLVTGNSVFEWPFSSANPSSNTSCDGASSESTRHQPCRLPSG